MERSRRFNKVFILEILFLTTLLFSAFSFAADDLSKDIAALKEEIKTAQEKLNKAKAGETLEKITIPVSIKNMQKILGSLSQKVSGDQNLSGKVKNLNNSLNSLEGAKNKNDKSGAQKILNDMTGALKGLETGLPPTAKAEEGVGPGVTKGTAPPKVQLPTSSLKITSFKKCVPPGTVAMSVGKSSDPIPEPTSITINIGEDICLSWKIEGCHVENVTERLTTGTGSQVPIDPGTKVDEGSGCFRIHNQKNLSPRETTTYTLMASGVPVIPGASASKTFTVNVRRPILTLLQPEVNLNNLTVKFFTRNDGDLDFGPDWVRVEYRIFLQSRGDYRDLGVESFTQTLSIRVGQRMELGERRLPERSVLSRFTQMYISVAIRTGYFSGRLTDYSYALTPVESVITSDLINIFGSALSGQIHLNNYDTSVTSERIRRIPARANDCYIELSGNRRNFSIDYVRLRGSILGISRFYLALINNLNASLGGRDFLSIVGGRLKMHIVFDTSGGREIKGWLQDIFDPDLWNDEQGPDIDITRLEMDVFLTLGLRDGRITYTEVQVEPTINIHVAGGWEWVDPFVRDHLQNILRNEVRNQMTSILMADAFRRRIEDELANTLRAIGISRIETLRAEGDRIIVTYYR